MTTEHLAERQNRPWTAAEDEAAESEMARETHMEESPAARGRHMTSEVQDAMAEARDELRSEGAERTQHMQEEAEERSLPDEMRRKVEGVARDRRAMAVSLVIALTAIVAAAVVLSRVATKPKTREEEILERSRDAFERSREALDSLVARMGELAER